MSSAANLPYIVIEDFWHPTEEQKQKMIDHVNAKRLENRSRDDVSETAWTTSTWLGEDEDDLFKQETFVDTEDTSKVMMQRYNTLLGDEYSFVNP